ncbi:hypothetical protein PSHT_16038 [Puccinia striiformis]|uniref:Uncharacterized protein n=1 Tax=Puccinia striiformis TaxID=27350 RepID=A0A2S4UBS5_9BASI|nr:hypothetical protein PSHT_16038 [Puccinia striiformis]
MKKRKKERTREEKERRGRSKEEEELKKKQDEERQQTLDGAVRRREEEAKRKEKENETMWLRGEPIRRSVQEVNHLGTDNRVPILEEEMTCSTIDKVGSRVDSGGDYMMKENNKERRLNAEVDSIQPKKLKKCRDSKISDRFQEFALMQLRILKNMGIYVDEEDIEEFKDLIKEIIEGLFLLEEDVKKM